ncbi:SDR family NAD(P)-dependent oxidoreductase [Aliiruegeria lutimaris]|uniref:NAD(P)-dependent dehydrogenase, short-chain alcohol dehydrogenase family n=1 Tax=Aliiruegeria lutimaris TaxID=571298 RepID=A0A1G8U6C1_9RHOB|nr:SDR family oxidoreductase [Aliiruegeria lutimaris]SDJ48590.1 NAD(P)-dependent dehydrogenase, short-chain alcohol dehydrogenase family [Aliiruegeria lutimaris]
MEMNLAGKTALITGSSDGIGLAVARGLAAEGVAVLINGRHADKVDQACKSIGELATPAVGDVATVDGIAAVLKAVSEAGGVDILINNAGTGSNETIMEAPDEKWQDYWDLHVMAAVRLARGVVPYMEARGSGVVLNNASICAVQPLWYEPIYNVTKAALMMFSRTLATELVGKNIRVNCVNPGLVQTPDWENTARELTAESGGDWQGYLQNVANEHAPIKRFCTPAELADFFVFLCSDRASYSIGSTYFVDGGMKVTV